MAKLIVKKSAVAAKVPLLTDLDYGELALNYADGKLYYKTSTNVIQNFSDSSTLQPLDADLTAIAALSGTTGLLRKTAANTWSLDTNSYITGNQTITFSGDASGSGTTSVSLTLANSGVTAGTYNNVATEVRPFTVDAKGRITSIGTAVTIAPTFANVASKPTTLSGYGITDALSNSTSSTQNGYFGDIFLYDDTTPSHYLGITNATNLTAARTLSINVNDADRTVSLSGNLTVNSAATISGTNTGDQTITLTGDVTGTGTGSFATTLANSGVTAGTYNNVATEVRPFTVDAKGRITSIGTAVTIAPTFANVASKPTTLSGYGITDAYTKTEVDSFLQGLDPKQTVRVATTTNITLSGTQTIDGVAVVANDRVLVKDQTTTSQNGIYIVAAGSWSRATDMNSWIEVPGAFVFVEEGATQADFGYVCTSNQGGTLDTTAITWVQFNGAANIVAGTGLSKTGNTLSIASSGVSAGTYTSVTVDTTGRITAGTNPGFITGNQTISFSGDATGSGTTSVSLTLANSGVTAGTYNNVATEVRPFTVDAKGRITSIGTAVTIAPTFANVASKPTTLSGYGITDAQPLDADLTAIAGLAGTTGLLRKTAADTWSLDTNSYITGNQTITFSGDATGSGTTSVSLTLANSGVTSGTYTSVTVDAKGRITAGTNPGFITGNQTISFSGDASGSGTTSVALTLANSGVTAGTYTSVTVDAKGRITAGTNPGFITGNQTISFSGDATGSGTTSVSLTLANSGVTAGTYNNVATEVRPFTVDAKGRITSIGTAVTIAPTFANVASKPTTLSGYGITDAQPLDADLTAIAGLAGTTGLLRKTAANTWSLDTSGMVTSVATSGSGLGFSLSGGPITSTGTITLTVPAAATLRTNLGLGSLATASSITTSSQFANAAWEGTANISSGVFFAGTTNGTRAWASLNLLKQYIFEDNGTWSRVVWTPGNTTLAVTGNITATGTITPGSDARLKSNIKPLIDPFKAVHDIQGVEYTLKSDNKDSIGFIAQEVMQHYPSLVIADSKGMLSLNYNGLVAIMWEQIKNLHARLSTLEN
jgi:phage-related tail fiber protein